MPAGNNQYQLVIMPAGNIVDIFGWLANDMLGDRWLAACQPTAGLGSHGCIQFVYTLS